MTREEWIVATEIAFEKLMTPTRGIPFDLMEEPIDDGGWSFLSLASHFTFWDSLVLRALEDLNHGRRFEWQLYADEEHWDAHARATARSQGYKRVLTELRLTHSTLTEAVRLVPDAKLLVNGEMPSWLIERVPAHYAQHTPQVEAWAVRLRREGRALPPLNILGGA